jgi:hypothetical protein
MEMFSKQEYKEALHTGVYSVTFTKADGTTREMLCTLKEEFLPEVNPDTASSRKENDDVVNVWDVEKDGWRSFRIDSVISFEPYYEPLEMQGN